MSAKVSNAVTPVQACLSTKREAILEWLDHVPDPFFHELETSIIKIVGEAGGLNHGLVTPTMNVIKTSTHLSKAPAVESVSSTDVLHKGIMACRWNPANLKHPV
ncbi:hypothetical protein JADG_007458 [Aureobasidium aubasidani]|nr:hypothetical protein JADG_007458 [Aureobasidium pullulans]